jgi:hypothetical protein
MSTSIEVQVAALLDDPLSAARAEAQRGRRVIGYVGPDVPVELILAAGAVPVRLVGNADTTTPHADRFVERAFVPEIRSIAEQWVTGNLDFLECVVLPRSNDSAQRLYYYLCELQRRESGRGPTPLIYDIGGIERQASALHTVAATLKLAGELGAQESSLPKAVDEAAEQIRTLHAISVLQRSEQPLRGGMAFALARALHFTWDPQFRRDLQDQAQRLEPAVGINRILLVGNSPPDDRLHWALENGGASVVRELTDANWFADQPRTESRVDSFEAIGLRAHARTHLARQLARSGDAILTAAQAVRADGVVIWLIEEDSALGWTLPDQLAALTRAGIPALVLTRQNWVAGASTLDSIERFGAGPGESR